MLTGQHAPRARAASAAEWVRRRGYRLLLLETEGACKKAARRTIGAEAGGSLKDDSFRPHLLPLLRELLLEQPAEVKPRGATTATAAARIMARVRAGIVAADDDDDATAADAAADAPADAAAAAKAKAEACTLRANAPRLAIVTDFGQQVSEAGP